MLKNEDLEKFIELFPNLSNGELTKMFFINDWELSKIRKRHNLKKTKEHKSKMISKRNKMVNRDLSFDNLKEIAKKYKTRGEFQLDDHSAYGSARVGGYLDEICSHMIKQSYSIPQMTMKYILDNLFNKEGVYNSRKIIVPYEIDLYYNDFNLAFEYDGKGWHKDNKNDCIKNVKLSEMGIFLIRIIENNRKYEEDIKSQIILNLEKINEISGLNISDSDVNNIVVDNVKLFSELFDDDKINDIISKYKYFDDFRKNESNLYEKLIKLKLLDKYTSCLERRFNINDWSDVNNIKNEISKYEYLGDFIEKSKGCYLHIIRCDNLKYLLNTLKRKDNTIWTDDKIKEEISKYKTLKDFRDNSKLFNSLKKNKRYMMDTLIRENERTKWDENSIKLEISKYDNIKDFRKKSYKCYRFIINHKEFLPMLNILIKI